MRRTAIALAALAFFALPLAAGKKKSPFSMTRPGMKAELATLPSIVAKQKCGNWAWAAGFEAMLRTQGAGAPLDQSYWITRLNGGEVCLDAVGRWEDLLRTLERADYVLDDGRKLRLEPRFIAGAPTVPDDLIMAMRRNQPIMLMWRGRGYLLAGVTYDEQIATTGSRMFEITELKLLDPYAAPAKGESIVT